jgi:Lhr-like helicase
VGTGGESLGAYPEYARLVIEDGRHVLKNRGQATRHRMSIGTIVSDAAIVVQYLRGEVLGSIEESFVARLKPGDRFFFSGTPLEFVRVRDMRAWVRRAQNTKGAIPRWMGSRMPLSGELAHLLRARLGEAADGRYYGPELTALEPLLETQRRWSAIPHADELLVERVQSRDGWHVFIYPLEGRLVHEGLAALFAYRMSLGRPMSFVMSSNDWGIELLCSRSRGDFLHSHFRCWWIARGARCRARSCMTESSACNWCWSVLPDECEGDYRWRGAGALSGARPVLAAPPHVARGRSSFREGGGISRAGRRGWTCYSSATT